MTIRSMTWADAFRPPTAVSPPDTTSLEAALIAESIECLLRATLTYDLNTTADRTATTALDASPRDARRQNTMAQLQECANALLSITIRLGHPATNIHAR